MTTAPTTPDFTQDSNAVVIAGAAPCSAKHLELIAELSIENRRYKAALERISKWFDEFPPTGRTWDDGTAMSYSAAFGSNGERDYMRQVAADALSPNDKGQPCEH